MASWRKGGDTITDVIIIGGGFTGLAAGYELARKGKNVAVLEGDPDVGGLAGSFDVGGEPLEKFYHHWFTNDRHVMGLVEELGHQDRVLYRPTRTGMYYANNFFTLSSPSDVLKFTPLGLLDRIRLGLMVLKARKVQDWMELENLTAAEWLTKLGGERVFKVVWEPLLRGKFGHYAADISAVWFWNKLKLRGGSRGDSGQEVLAYYKGGFAALAQAMREVIERQGGQVMTNTHVSDLIVRNGAVVGVRTGNAELYGKAVLATPALPIIAEMMKPHVAQPEVEKLQKIDYLANVCLVLELDRSLSDTYWLNVNDPSFPYVGVIEHTNFEPAETYQGRRIVYLSKYLPESDALYQMSQQEAFEYSLPHIKRMFPDFDRSWVKDYHVWKARYSQPIVGKNYSELIPGFESSLDGFFISSMAQVYPEDRGTNYAIREGREAGRKIGAWLDNQGDSAWRESA